MYNYFVYNRDDFLQHYHLRSNVESTNNMIKSKFTDLVRSKDKTAQINEVLLNKGPMPQYMCADKRDV